MPTFVPSGPQHLATRRAPANQARANPFLGIALTKEQKYEKSLSKVQKHKTNYYKCKERRTAKGKVAAPDPEAPKTGGCWHDYKSWQKWAGKQTERATKVRTKLATKGKLSPELDRELARAESGIDLNASRASVSQRPLSPAAKAALVDATSEVLDEEIMAGEDPFGEEEESSLPMILVAVGGIALVGGAFWYMSKKKAE